MGKICNHDTGERLLVYRGELRKVKFRGKQLPYADLRGANLRSADFEGANLEHADFRGASLYHASFKNTNLEDANFGGAYCIYADFQGACLDGTDFSRAELSFADFGSADLNNVEFAAADLTRVNFSNVQTNGSDTTLAAWILCNAAGDDPDKRSLAGLVLFSGDWCWPDFVALQHPARAWAIEVLGTINGYREELIGYGLLKVEADTVEAATQVQTQ